MAVGGVPWQGSELCSRPSCSLRTASTIRMRSTWTRCGQCGEKRSKCAGAFAAGQQRDGRAAPRTATRPACGDVAMQRGRACRYRDGHTAAAATHGGESAVTLSCQLKLMRLLMAMVLSPCLAHVSQPNPDGALVVQRNLVPGQCRACDGGVSVLSVLSVLPHPSGPVPRVRRRSVRRSKDYARQTGRQGARRHRQRATNCG